MTLKYRFTHSEMLRTPDGTVRRFYRIIALRNIPRHNVKMGDVGGYVLHHNILSHDGDCWVGGTARVEDEIIYDYDGLLAAKPTVIGNALVSGNAYVFGGLIEDDARIVGNAILNSTAINGQTNIAGEASLYESTIKGKIFVGRKTLIEKSTIQGSGTIEGNVNIDRANISGEIVIRGGVDILPNVKLMKGCYIVGPATIPKGHQANNLSINGPKNENAIFAREVRADDIELSPISTPKKTNPTVVLKREQLANLSYGDTEIDPMDGTVTKFYPDKKSAKRTSDIPKSDNGTVDNKTIENSTNTSDANRYQEYINTINDIIGEYESYTTDIVKLIKYPAMMDASVPEIHDFMTTLRQSKRALKNNSPDLVALAVELDRTYCLAENTALTMSSSHLTVKQKSSLTTASQLFKLACDKDANENEKRSGFKAGLRALDGIIAVPEKAIDNLKEKIGLLELEA